MTAWTSPRTWTSETLTSSLLNTHVRDNLNHLSEQISRTGWTAFTPAWTNLTVGNGTNTGKYAYAGKTTHFYVEFTFGSTSSISGSVSLTLNEAAVTYLFRHPIGQVELIDDSAAVAVTGQIDWGTSTTGVVTYQSVSGSNVIRTVLSSTAPFTWATSDKILIHASYERT